jgi:PKD repeat protein
MKIITFLILAFFNCFLLHAQMVSDKECGTKINSSNIERLRQQNKQWLSKVNNNTQEKSYDSTSTYVPVQIHIIRETGGFGGISAVDAIAAFDRLNMYYIDAGIHFFQCASINYIDNTVYYDYDKTQMNALYGAYGVTNVINIYVANTVSSSGSLICGHAQFPGGLDFLIQSASCMKNGSTLAHEVGHYLGLYHTHETYFGNEAVNGSDCYSEGDLLCDTPADPELSSSTNLDDDGCIYYGANTDENGNSYSPSVTNVMSYSAKNCRYTFTEDQYNKLLWTLQNERFYLTCFPPTLASYFYISAQETCDASKQFSFYNASEGNIMSYNWDFGDGLGTSTLESPSYTYSNNGIYTVSLTVSDNIFTETHTETIVVGTVDVPYTNGFESGPYSLYQFEKYSSMKNEIAVHTAAAQSGNYGLLFDGTETSSTSPYFQTPTTSTAFEPLWNPYFKTRAELCVNALNQTNLQLEFDKRQIQTINDNYTNFRIAVNGTILGSVYQVNTNSTDDPNFTHVIVDLSAYDGQVITISFESTHKYDKDRGGTNSGTATFIDNINITGTPILTSNELKEFPSTSDGSNVKPVKIYPNPTSHQLSIISNQLNINEINIVDITGKSIKRITTDFDLVDVSNLTNGIYFIQLITEERTITKKFVKH